MWYLCVVACIEFDDPNLLPCTRNCSSDNLQTLLFTFYIWLWSMFWLHHMTCSSLVVGAVCSSVPVNQPDSSLWCCSEMVCSIRWLFHTVGCVIRALTIHGASLILLVITTSATDTTSRKQLGCPHPFLPSGYTEIIYLLYKCSRMIKKVK